MTRPRVIFGIGRNAEESGKHLDIHLFEKRKAGWWRVDGYCLVISVQGDEGERRK